MEKTFEPKGIEAKWYPLWESRGYFAPIGFSNRGVPADAAQGGRAKKTGVGTIVNEDFRDADNAAMRGPNVSAYCIMIPPPNVTGSLHMGHAFQDTLMDTLTRYQRMRGASTLWQPGTDHAGIATQMVVERQLAAQGITRHDLGRDKFIERVWQWKAESGGTITRQLRRLGASVDWSRERFTMDEGLSRAVTEVFVRLYEKGLIYRGKRLVNWDPVLHTAVSDLEVISEEENGSLWHMRYPLTDGSGHVVVATTRPETMLGDTAVAVHPEDERYKQLIGKTIRLPLAEREIPIIGDEYVDPEFGSGCVKITPAHDFNDYAVGQRHQLPLINIFTVDAALNENAPEKYRGMDRFAARKQIIADLDATGLLDKTEVHKLMVPRGDRTHAVIEPYLTDQWYVKVAPLAESAVKSVEDGSIRFVPESWSKTFFEWMKNIQDWCISRQIWWGHRIPAWYDEAGNIYVGRDEAEVREKHDLNPSIALSQDEDVLDTWFSSALWPFSTLGWPEQTPELKRFYPTSVLVTGFDIIFFWVARMIMMGQAFAGDVPFREVYIHGLIRDAEGQKMSKSKGNVLDPLDIIDGIELEPLVAKRTSGLMQPQLAKRIEKATRKEFPDGIAAYGVDALRFTFAALATTGRDIRFDLGRVSGYRNFCNKLWNAARYVLMNTEDQDCGLDSPPPQPSPIKGEGEKTVELSLADRWIISRLQHAEAEVARNLDIYRFDLAAQAIYEFVWYEFCDWYLELSKPALQQGNTAQQRGTRRTLVRVLESLMRLAHPVMPFITEEIWQRAAPLAGVKGDTIMLQPYPQADVSKRDPSAESEMAWLQGFILGLRQIRGEMDIAPGTPLPVLAANASDEDRERTKRHWSLIDFLARVEDIRFLDANEQPPESATALLGEMKLLVPMAGLIDKEAEVARLQKQIDARRKVINGSESRLANPQFVANAPAAVVEKERATLTEQQRAVAELQAQLSRIQSL